MTLWHSEIKLPAGFTAPTGTVALEYSAHAIAACKNDRYGRIRQFGRISLNRFRVVEVETDAAGKVTKYVLRGTYENGNDVVLAVNPRNGRPWFVRTVWLNRSTDSHGTLDRSKYAN